MKVGSPIEALAAALYSALLRDLPDIEYDYISPAGRKSGKAPERRYRRPQERDVEVHQFPQVWGDTSLGFGGMAGQSVTTADTTVIIAGDHAAVYFAGRFAYLASTKKDEFWQALANRNMPGRTRCSVLTGGKEGES